MLITNVCLVCNARIAINHRTGRKRQYCSDRCRVEASAPTVTKRKTGHLRVKKTGRLPP